MEFRLFRHDVVKFRLDIFLLVPRFLDEVQETLQKAFLRRVWILPLFQVDFSPLVCPLGQPVIRSSASGFSALLALFASFQCMQKGSLSALFNVAIMFKVKPRLSLQFPRWRTFCRSRPSPSPIHQDLIHGSLPTILPGWFHPGCQERSSFPS